jgi:hypothetical protein
MSHIKEAIHNPNVQSVMIAATIGVGLVAPTTIYDHREVTHESVKTKPFLEHASRALNSAVGVRPRIWGRGVHRTHHAFPDANFTAILELADYAEWRDSHNVDQNLYPEPAEVYSNLDPEAVLTVSDILLLGDLVRPLVKDRYDVPETYSLQKAQEIIDTEQERYLYKRTPGLLQRIIGDSKTDFELAEPRSVQAIAPELRDAHSPALHRLGVLGVLLGNAALYKVAAKYYKLREEAGDDFGKDKWDERIYDKTRIAASAFFGVNIALQLLIGRNNTKNHNITRQAARGSLVALGGITVLLAGGNITNSIGHGGKNPIRSLFSRKPTVKSDGTYAANTKALSGPTLDEVGGQEDHHRWPWLIAYTTRKGLQKLYDAPFGSTLDGLAAHSILLDPGTQFGHPDLYTLEEARSPTIATSNNRERRPDETTEAVLVLQGLRRRTLIQKSSSHQEAIAA